MSTVQQNAHAAQTANAMMNHMLRMQLYVITTVAKASREQIEALLPAHLAHQVALEKEGVLFGAGPVSGEDGARKHGMIIVRADSFEQARAIADRDPFHKAGLRSYSVDRWSLNEGSLTFTVNFSDQSVRTA